MDHSRAERHRKSPMNKPSTLISKSQHNIAVIVGGPGGASPATLPRSRRGCARIRGDLRRLRGAVSAGAGARVRGRWKAQPEQTLTRPATLARWTHVEPSCPVVEIPAWIRLVPNSNRGHGLQHAEGVVQSPIASAPIWETVGNGLLPSRFSRKLAPFPHNGIVGVRSSNLLGSTIQFHAGSP